MIQKCPDPQDPAPSNPVYKEISNYICLESRLQEINKNYFRPEQTDRLFSFVSLEDLKVHQALLIDSLQRPPPDRKEALIRIFEENGGETGKGEGSYQEEVHIPNHQDIIANRRFIDNYMN